MSWCVVGIAIGLYFFTTLDARTLAQLFNASKLAKSAFRANMSAMLLSMATVRGIGNRIHFSPTELMFKRTVWATLMACSAPLLLKCCGDAVTIRLLPGQQQGLFQPRGGRGQMPASR